MMQRRDGETIAVIVSCEHASRLVPKRFEDAFASARDALATHRGSDIGALELARRFAKDLDAPLFATRVSRLLVDTNRSHTSKSLFSAWSRELPAHERERIVEEHWRPHREAVEGAVVSMLETADVVLHWSVHSFTPNLNGDERRADIGLLYDPSRTAEREFAGCYARILAAIDPALRIRKNYPYRGTSDGLTRHLRTRFAAGRYLGIELEVNQRFPLGQQEPWVRLQRQLIGALRDSLETYRQHGLRAPATTRRSR
ncbi:MAG: N-formylglutamate amidohydrolase [Planctomycetes bacterium]|nr:N-formylglutamate amidohydrolase [Planctomycetota bacterium]MCB9920436.1 N-formylglutamate amidohydrolase [Planctomycetota bacterium]